MIICSTEKLRLRSRSVLQAVCPEPEKYRTKSIPYQNLMMALNKSYDEYVPNSMTVYLIVLYILNKKNTTIILVSW